MNKQEQQNCPLAASHECHKLWLLHVLCHHLHHLPRHCNVVCLELVRSHLPFPHTRCECHQYSPSTAQTALSNIRISAAICLLVCGTCTHKQRRPLFFVTTPVTAPPQVSEQPQQQATTATHTVSMLSSCCLVSSALVTAVCTKFLPTDEVHAFTETSQCVRAALTANNTPRCKCETFMCHNIPLPPSLTPLDIV